MISLSDQPISHENSQVLTHPLQKDHIVKFYEDEKTLTDAVTAYVGSGLTEGDGIILITTPKHREALEKSLALKGFNVHEASIKKQLIFKDAAHTLSQFMENQVPNEEKFRALIGAMIEEFKPKYSKIRAYGEMVNLLLVDGNLTETIGLEELWNSLSLTYSFSLLCSYLISDFNEKLPEQAYQKVCQTHSHSLPVDEPSPQILSQLQKRIIELEREVTGRKKIELVLQEAIRCRDEAFPVASHELKTPLTCLKLQIQLLQRLISKETESKNSQKVRKTIDGCEYQIDRMTKLTDQILDLSQIRLGRFKLCPEPFDLIPFVQKMVDQFAELMSLSGQPQFKNLITLSSEVSTPGMWDQSRFGQIITNLLSNAVKYGNGKPVEICVFRTLDKNRVRLTVRDFGIGIAAENQAKIFNRFEQIGSGSHTPGLGLGLYIVQQIVSDSGGTIEVQSEINRGSIFKIELPLILSKIRDAQTRVEH
ncbi:MAG: ATP-binding protein [Bdellovibrionia bacterium]